MAASRVTQEVPRVNSNIPKTTCCTNEISNCQATRSKALLLIEHNAVSKDAHLAKLLAKQSEKSCDKPIGKIQRLPPSSVLNQVKSFLPQMKNANDEINAAIASGADYDIENVDDAEQAIEMNLTLVEREGDSSDESESESESDSDSELENNDNLHRPEPRKSMIQEINPSTPRNK